MPGQPHDGTVLFLGDSLSKAYRSANWINLLASDPAITTAGYTTFRNVAEDGHLSTNVLRDLHAVLSPITNPPAVVVLLVGANDVMSTLSAQWRGMYAQLKQILDKPSLARYTSTICAILDAIHAQTPHARILVVTLSPLGSEDLQSPLNRRVARYNVALCKLIREAAAADGMPVQLVDFAEAVKEQLLAATAARGGGSGVVTASQCACDADSQKESGACVDADEDNPQPLAELPFRTFVRRMWWATVQHYWWGVRWDATSASRGFQLLTSDGVHLNEQAAALLAGQVKQVLLQGQ